MTDKKILRMKLNLKDSVLDEKGKEEFLEKVEQFTDVFSLRDEIGTCPFIEVHLKLKDETPFFVRPYPIREEQKKVIQKEMDRLKHLGIIHKGLTSYSSPVVLVKQKNQNLYRVCSDFRILKEKLVKINHAFPLVRDCIEQLGRKKCHYLSMIDLRDTFHTLITKMLRHYTILWITYIPLLMHGYGYECKSTNLVTVCRSRSSHNG